MLCGGECVVPLLVCFSEVASAWDGFIARGSCLYHIAIRSVLFDPQPCVLQGSFRQDGNTNDLRRGCERRRRISHSSAVLKDVILWL